MTAVHEFSHWGVYALGGTKAKLELFPLPKKDNCGEMLLGQVSPYGGSDFQHRMSELAPYIIKPLVLDRIAEATNARNPKSGISRYLNASLYFDAFAPLSIFDRGSDLDQFCNATGVPKAVLFPVLQAAYGYSYWKIAKTAIDKHGEFYFCYLHFEL